MPSMAKAPHFCMQSPPRKDQISQEQFRLLDHFLRVARENRVIEPGGSLEGNPVCLRRLVFPTVSQLSLLGIADIEAKRLVGQQKFDNVSFRSVDFSQSDLDFSVWSKCHFQEAKFDRASLQSCRFFGCGFTECSFVGTNCANGSFSVEIDGSETSFHRCLFENTKFRGVSWCKPTFTKTSFIRCRFSKGEFDGASFEASRFVGNYEELSFRGDASIGQRNRLDIDMTGADVAWLHANHGVDLAGLRLLPNGPSMVIQRRGDAIPILVRRLVSERKDAGAVAYMLENIFTEKSVSPLSSSQQTVFISARMIQELDETLTKDQAVVLLQTIRRIAVDEGFAG